MYAVTALYSTADPFRQQAAFFTAGYSYAFHQGCSPLQWDTPADSTQDVSEAIRSSALLLDRARQRFAKEPVRGPCALQLLSSSKSVSAHWQNNDGPI